MFSAVTGSERRRRQVGGIAGASLLLSLIGGILVLLFSTNAPTKTAIKKIQPPTTTVTVTPTAAPDSTDLSMFGLGDALGGVADAGTTPDSLGAPSLGASSGLGSASAPAVSSLPGDLPAGSLPSAPDSALEPINWDAVLNSISVAQQNAQAAGVAGSVIGAAAGITSAAISSTAVVIGDLILYSAISNNGPAVLSQLQTTLSAPAVAAVAPALTQAVPSADFTGLSTAFAAAAAAPPVGVPVLPALPPLPQLPPLPPPPNLDGLAAGIAALPAIGAIPGFALPELPPLPQLPKPEDVIGGIGGAIVGATIAGAVLGAILPQPPSITRMMGLPF